MAAAVAVEDDETWLYGDENKEKETAKAKGVGNGVGKKDDPEDGQLSGEDGTAAGARGTEDSDDDDDEDDVQVTIGDIRTWSVAEGGNKLFKGSGTYQKPAGVVISKTTSSMKGGMDIEMQGNIEGVPTYEFDISNIEDKPWRKPGADITDYFNYGFDEDTWQQYCEKQKRMRNENGTTSFKMLSGTTIKQEKDFSQQGSAVVTLIGRKAFAPPNRKYYGTIDVIGSTARDSRRPGDTPSVIPVTTTTDYSTLPPPGMPPPALPDYSVPPPGLGPPPTMLPPSVTPNISLPPPNYPPPPGFYPTPGALPPSEPYDDRGAYVFDPVTGTYVYGASSWDGRNSYERYNYSRRDRSPLSDEDYSRNRDRERSGSHYRERERSRDRGRDRERERERSRDRDRERERGRSRDRDSSRERRHRDEKHKRRRFKEEKDSDEQNSSSSSKHKKSRRKREKEEEELPTDDNVTIKKEKS